MHDPLLHSVPPALQQASANPHLCQRLLDSHRQVWVSLQWGHCSFLLGPGVHKAGQRLIEFCQENALVIANTLFQQHKRGLYTWTSPEGQYLNQTDYIICSPRWRSSIHLAKTRPGADCGSDHQFLIAQFRPKLKKVGKTLAHSGMA